MKTPGRGCLKHHMREDEARSLVWKEFPQEPSSTLGRRAASAGGLSSMPQLVTCKERHYQQHISHGCEDYTRCCFVKHFAQSLSKARNSSDRQGKSMFQQGHWLHHHLQRREENTGKPHQCVSVRAAGAHPFRGPKPWFKMTK